MKLNMAGLEHVPEQERATTLVRVARNAFWSHAVVHMSWAALLAFFGWLFWR